MVKSIFILLCAVAAFAVENPWAKVEELKSGSELRIIRHGEPKPLLATLEEVHDDSVVVATKTEEISIPKSTIDRIDSRPAHSGGRVHKETRTTETGPDYSGPDNQPRADRPNQSSSTSLSFGGGKDFETVYRRTSAAPAAK